MNLQMDSTKYTILRHSPLQTTMTLKTVLGIIQSQQMTPFDRSYNDFLLMLTSTYG